MLRVFFVIGLAGQLAHAQLSGGVPVRVAMPGNVPSRCIDVSKDRVWLKLTRLVTTRTRGWLRRDRDVAVIINAQVKTDPQPPKPLTFPLMAKARFGNVPSGQVSVPIEYTVVSGLRLTQSNVHYTGMEMSVTLLNIRERTRLGTAIEALSTITSAAKLPIPTSPFIQGATYLLDFANSTVQKDLDAHNSNDKVVSGSLAFNFAPDGNCPSGEDFETTGTKAILYSAGRQGPGYIDIGRTRDYCIAADITPVFLLKVAQKTPGQDCPDPEDGAEYRDVTNNYVAFFLNKRTVSRQSGLRYLDEQDRQESLARCREHGITDPAQCPGGN